MSSFIPFTRDQAFLLPPDPRASVLDDDLAHVIVAAVERLPIHPAAFARCIGLELRALAQNLVAQDVRVSASMATRPGRR